MDLVSKKEAKERGLKLYFTGLPCRNGHISERRTYCGHCVTCQSESMKKQHNKNRKKVRDYNREYQRKNKTVLAKRRKERNNL